MPKRNFKAYTLIEMLIVIGVFTALGFLALPMAVREIEVGRTDSFVKELKSSIQLVAQDSYSGKDDSAHGIALSANGYIVYTGASLASATDQLSFSAPSSVSIANISLTDDAIEINFPKGDIRPDVHGSFQVIDEYNSFTFDINREGLLLISRDL